MINLWNQTSSAEFIGRATVNLRDIPDVDNEEKGNEIPQPQWHQLRSLEDSSEPVGEILCSFVVVELDYDLIPSEEI